MRAQARPGSGRSAGSAVGPAAWATLTAAGRMGFHIGIPGLRDLQDAVGGYVEAVGFQLAGSEATLWIAEEGLRAAMPVGYSEFVDNDGTPYFVKDDTGESSWEHPLDSYYRELVVKHRSAGLESESSSSIGSTSFLPNHAHLPAQARTDVENAPTHPPSETSLIKSGGRDGQARPMSRESQGRSITRLMYPKNVTLQDGAGDGVQEKMTFEMRPTKQRSLLSRLI